MNRFWYLLRYHRPGQLARRARNLVARRVMPASRNRRYLLVRGPIQPRDCPGLRAMAESRLALHAEGAAERAEAIRTGQLCFVGECHEVDVPIDYRSAAFSEASDLWRFNLHYHEFLLDLVAAERQPSESLSEKGDGHPAPCIRIGQGTRPPGASPRFRTDSESWEDMVWRVVDGWMREHRPDDPQALRDAWHPFCISRRLPVWATLIALGSAEPGQRRACPKRGTGTLHLESGLGKGHDIREPVPVFGQTLRATTSCRLGVQSPPHIGNFFRGADDLLDGTEELVEAEWLVQDGFQAGLSGFDDRVARVVAEAGHQYQRRGRLAGDFFEPAHEVVARHVGQPDVGDDHVVFDVRHTTNHERRLGAVVGRFDRAVVAFQ